MRSPNWSNLRLRAKTLEQRFPAYPKEVLSHPNCPASVWRLTSARQCYPHVILHSPYFQFLSLEDPAEFLTQRALLWIEVLSRCTSLAFNRATECTLQFLLLDQIEPIFLRSRPHHTGFLSASRSMRLAWASASYDTSLDRDDALGILASQLERLRQSEEHRYLTADMWTYPNCPALVAWFAITARSTLEMIRVFQASTVTASYVSALGEMVMTFIQKTMPDFACLDPTQEERDLRLPP